MPTTAADIRAGLARRWPDSEYQRVEEVSLSSDRQGRRIDVLVISLWRSRGHEVDAVEIKVSMSDWKRELDRPEKADGWYDHCDRFWIACPPDIAPKIAEQLPSTWGLLAVTDAGSNIVVKAPKHDRRPFTWSQQIGLIRAAADAGPNMLARARSEGDSAGYKRGLVEGERRTGEGHARQQLEELRATIAEFEEAAGFKIDTGFRGSPRLGQLVAIASTWATDPVLTGRRIAVAAGQLSEMGKALEKLAADITATHEPTPADVS